MGAVLGLVLLKDSACDLCGIIF